MKKVSKILNLCLVLFVCIGTVSCGPKLKTQRLSVSKGDEKAMEITDNWMATDTQNAISSILTQLAQHKGYQKYISKMNGQQPKLFIAELQNNTAEAYFPIQDMNDELLTELSSSGEYILIDEAARERILKEIKYQNDGMVAAKDVKNIGQASGADIMIFGNINMKPEMLNGKTIKEYSVNIRLTDITTGIEIARVRYKISKYSERSGYRW